MNRKSVTAKSRIPTLNRRLLGSFAMILGILLGLIMVAFVIVLLFVGPEMEGLKQDQNEMKRQGIHSAGGIYVAVMNSQLNKFISLTETQRKRLQNGLMRKGQEGLKYARLMTLGRSPAVIASAYRDASWSESAPVQPDVLSLNPFRRTDREANRNLKAPDRFRTCERIDVADGIDERRVVIYSEMGERLRPLGVLILGAETGPSDICNASLNDEEKQALDRHLPAFFDGTGYEWVVPPDGANPPGIQFTRDEKKSPDEWKSCGDNIESMLSTISDEIGELSQYFTSLNRGTDSLDCFSLYSDDWKTIISSRESPRDATGGPPAACISSADEVLLRNASTGLSRTVIVPDGDSRYLLRVPVYLNGEQKGALVFRIRGLTSIYTKAKYLFDRVSISAIVIVLGLTILMIALSAVYVFRLRRKVAGPLDDLIRIGEDFARGDKTAPVHLENARALAGTDFYASELQEVSGTYCRMVGEIQDNLRDKDAAFEELKATQERLISSEKQAVLGTVAGGVAHEIKNALNPVRLRSELLLDGLKAGRDVDLTDGLELIIRNVKRCTELSNRLSSFAKPSDILSQHDYDLNSVIRDALMISKDLLDNEKIEVTTELAEIPPLKGLPMEIQQVLINFILNARDAIVDGRKADGGLGGHLQISTKATADVVEFRISDDGCGMDEDTVSKIFEPFFTTKEAGKGTGLGMSISLSIIRAHRGEIEVSSKQHKGTSLTVRFPTRVYPAPIKG